jgi:hypothetical protein
MPGQRDPVIASIPHHGEYRRVAGTKRASSDKGARAAKPEQREAMTLRTHVLNSTALAATALVAGASTRELTASSTDWTKVQ